MSVMEETRVLEGFSHYDISRDGSVFSRLTNTRLAGSTNPAGYVNYRLTRDDGHTVTIGRHRLLGLAFLTVPDNPEAMVINHRNGVKGDDRLENLEWTTPKGNVEHAGALGLSSKCTPISTRNPSTGQVTHYPSYREAARDLSLSKDAISWRVMRGEDRMYPEGLQYRIRDDVRPWLTPVSNKHGRSQPTQVKDIVNGEVTLFEKQSDLAAFLRKSLAIINTWSRDPSQPLINGRYLLKLVNDRTPWRTVTNPALESKVLVAVIARNAITNEELVFNSAVECAKFMSLSPTALSERLKSNGSKVFKDGYSYRRFNQK